jgi:type I restriction enzyme S subunit
VAAYSVAKILIAKNDLFNFKFIYEAMQIINFVSTDHKRYWISEYQNLKLPIPPLPEQQKIAEILSTWDGAITNCKTTINTLKDRNKGLAQQLLTGNKRLSGFSDKWKKTQLGNIINRVTSKNEELNDTVVTISAQRGFVLQEDFFNKRVASDTLSGYYLINKGQFAYNKSYSNGYPMGAFKRLNDFEKAVVTTLYFNLL